MIGEELLSEVLEKKVREISNSERDARERGYHTINGIFVIFEDNQDNMINIYELAHKCKEWAFVVYGIRITTTILNDIRYMSNIKSVGHFDSDTEPEAIFKACQWILDNKDNQ